MNKRLEELAIKCNAWNQVYDQKRFMVDGNFDVERFAELIVYEMLKTCEEHPGWYGRDIGKQIKQHFGVEQ